MNPVAEEIKRLTAERDEFEANLTIAERQVTEAQSERDHWHNEALRLSAAALAERAERDRLRAALEKISEYAWLDESGNEVAQPPWVELARKSLAVSADETKVNSA